jgi:hypothetical protein
MTGWTVLLTAWLVLGGLGVIGGFVGVRRAERRLRATAPTSPKVDKDLLAA